VTRPADAYVAEFTRDVPRAKVITAQDVMTPVASEVEIGGTVPMHLSLEMVIPRFESAVEALACTDESGEVRGHITAQGVLAALAAEAAVAEGTAAR
jgi:glycine betaine/proline transport system ATP-binding protein